MKFSKWTWGLALLVPWVSVGALGIHAQVSEPYFAHPEYGPARSGEIEAYIPLIARTRSLLATETPVTNFDDVRSLARDWVGAYRLGLIRTIHRAHAVDTIRGGARRQILDAMSLVSFHLQFSMRESGKLRDVQQLGEDGMLALELAQLLKTEDIASYGVALNNENAVLRTWATYGVALSPQDYSRVRRWVSNEVAMQEYSRVLTAEMEFATRRARSDKKVDRAVATLVSSTRQLENGVPAISYHGLPSDAIIAIQLARNARAVLRQRQAYLENLLPREKLVADANIR